MPNLSPWFEWPTKPVHVGVYPTMIPGWEHLGIYYSLWANDCWHGDKASIEEAMEVRTKSACQERLWFGLAEKPAGHDCKKEGCKHG